MFGRYPKFDIDGFSSNVDSSSLNSDAENNGNWIKGG